MKRYIRFIVQSDHDSPTRCTGVVASLRLLAEADRLPEYHVEYAKELFERLNNELPCPPFSTNDWADCVSWFKNTSKEWITVFREIIAILEDSDFHVATLTTDRPGMIVYEDEFQVVAKSPEY
ncbi:MAG: hypothetical protein IPK22_08880 [Verrucomicrobiaceae bacterium]|nr:hypothetical protein [Verrucomicrobiaceae bacterium]